MHMKIASNPKVLMLGLEGGNATRRANQSQFACGKSFRLMRARLKPCWRPRRIAIGARGCGTWQSQARRRQLLQGVELSREHARFFQCRSGLAVNRFLKTVTLASKSYVQQLSY